MAEHNLYGPQIGPALEQVRREGVPEGVRAYILGDPRLKGLMLYYLPVPLARHPLPQSRDEERFRLPRLEHRRSRRPKVFEEFLARLVPHGDYPLLGPLSVNNDEAELEVHVVEFQTDELRHPDSRGVERLQHGRVPEPLGGGFVRGREQFLYFVECDYARKPLFHFRRGYAGGGVFLYDLLHEEVLEELPYRYDASYYGGGVIALIFELREVFEYVAVFYFPRRARARFFHEKDKFPQVPAVGFE